MAISVNSAVAHIIENNPFIKTVLELDIVSYSKLARHMKHEIEELANKDVSVSSIVMAISRYAEKRHQKKKRRFKIKDMVTRTGLSITTVKRTYAEDALKLYKKFDIKSGDFLQISIGRSEVTIVYNTDKNHIVSKQLRHTMQNKSNIALLSIAFPEEYLNIPGFIDYIIRPIALANINIIEIISTYEELNIFFDEKDLLKAYSVLKSWIGK